MEKTNDKNNSILESFLNKLHQGELNKSGVMMQVCDSDRTAAYTLRVIAEVNADPAQVLVAV